METITAGSLQAIVDRIVDRFRPDRVVLFGSHAYGTPHEGSDIDLLIVAKHTFRLVESHRLAREIAPDVPLQLVFMDPLRWEETRDVVGGVAYPAHHGGQVLYEA